MFISLLVLEPILKMRYGAFCKYYHPAEEEKWKCCKLCSHPVTGWQDAPLGIFGLWSIQVATISSGDNLNRVILLAVGWYLRFSLSYRDVEELLTERGLHADHVPASES